MDRDRELSDEYTKISGMLERFDKRQALKVEGDWYLFEQEGFPSFVVDDGWLARMVGENPIEYLESMGWKVTPVIIFRNI